jgi:hypothetical protein
MWSGHTLSAASSMFQETFEPSIRTEPGWDSKAYVMRILTNFQRQVIMQPQGACLSESNR